MSGEPKREPKKEPSPQTPHRPEPDQARGSAPGTPGARAGLQSAQEGGPSDGPPPPDGGPAVEGEILRPRQLGTNPRTLGTNPRRRSWFRNGFTEIAFEMMQEAEQAEPDLAARDDNQRETGS